VSASYGGWLGGWGGGGYVGRKVQEEVVPPVTDRQPCKAPCCAAAGYSTPSLLPPPLLLLVPAHLLILQLSEPHLLCCHTADALPLPHPHLLLPCLMNTPHPPPPSFARALSSVSGVAVLDFRNINFAFGNFTHPGDWTRFAARMAQATDAWCCSKPMPGHIPYDMLWDVVPHRDKYGTEWNTPWAPLPHAAEE
jgi:hypothetical protein